MNITKEERHNRMLNKIINPEIERLKRVEIVSGIILHNLKEKVEIDCCGLDECHLINTISRVIGQYIK